MSKKNYTTGPLEEKEVGECRTRLFVAYSYSEGDITLFEYVCMSLAITTITNEW